MSRQVLFESFGVSVVDHRCTIETDREGPEEVNPSHSIVFLRRGGFRRTERGRTVLADPNHVLFFNAGQPYRFSHPLPGGDRCTAVAIETGPALEILSRRAPSSARRAEAPFDVGHGLCSPRAARLHFQLLALLRDLAPPLAAGDAVAELADEAVRAAYPGPTTSPGTARGRRRGEEIVEAVKLAVSARPDDVPSLPDLARDLGCSPFHLSHAFRRAAGLSLREYAARIRARLAADLLTRGERGLTGLALDLGYSDHSHFTNSFRRAWGMAPSRFRSLLGPLA